MERLLFSNRSQFGLIEVDRQEYCPAIILMMLFEGVIGGCTIEITLKNLAEQFKITLIYSSWIEYVKNCDIKNTESFMHMGGGCGLNCPKSSELFMGGIAGLSWSTCIELFSDWSSKLGK